MKKFIMIKFLKIFTIFQYFFLILSFVNSQSTDDCGTIYGCFTSPTSCIDTNCKFIYKWSTENKPANEFIIAAKIDQIPPDSAWVAVGFSNDNLMGDDNVILCKNSPNDKSINYYQTTGKVRPELLDENNPTIGLSDSNVTLNQGFLICSFTRDKRAPSKNYFNLNKKFFLLAAFGPVSNNGEILQHVTSISSDDRVFFSNPKIKITLSDNQALAKTHACIMVISWIIIASSGILIARYYKFVFPNERILDMKIWFFLHRPLMISVAVLTAISFLIILSDKNWKWINTNQKSEFAHSIFGIIALVLALIQIIVSCFRPSPESFHRPIFNMFHRWTAIIAYACALLAMFIGTALKRMNLGSKGYGILIGWTLFVVTFLVLIEMLNKKYSISLPDFQPTLSMQKTGYNNSNIQRVQKGTRIPAMITQAKLENLKKAGFFIHLISCLAFGVALIVNIAEGNLLS